jgi:GTPase
MILPSLPEALPELQAPQQPAKLLHGLEESRGALYEIGVADNGALVGLTEDEMRESLNNLKAMAACLGCCVEVLREETVGECEWLEDVSTGRQQRQVRRTGKLIVVEALVKPYLASEGCVTSNADTHGEIGMTSGQPLSSTVGKSTEQLRLALIGPTMSGKSTLLGTLTTSTLDNGRGSSRLSMLKHRHEINSGVTSSVTQELIGYQDSDHGNVHVINYATENVASWIDIHASASGSRLVLISDSAGHPRYRRTTVRGLLGWAPHWTLLCVPADDTEMSGDSASNPSHLSSAVSEMELSEAQLQLCMKLHLPLIIVITKLDLASKTGLRDRLTKVLDTLKAAGRKPTILGNPPADVAELDLQIIESSAIDRACQTAFPLLNGPAETVPIVLTSAVHGTGVSNLHALLHELPIPENNIDRGQNAQGSRFELHIEDIFSKPAEVDGLILSGLLRAGQIRVGDIGILGPFSTSDLDDSEDSEDRPAHQLRPPQQLPTSRSFPGALRDLQAEPLHLRLPNREWRRVKVTSVRNLRLPVHSLLVDQVGTVALVPIDAKGTSNAASTLGRIRKGMVLQNIQPSASRSFEAVFKREDLENLSVNHHVVVYVASIRASARVVSARAPDSPQTSRRQSYVENTFEFDEIRASLAEAETFGENERVAGAITAARLIVTFAFNASKEFIRVGEQVLIMPGGGPGLYGGHERGERGVAGLEGFVGTIVDCSS